MAAILVYVVLYSRFAGLESYRRQIENFEDTTVTMEQVTENYLEGEQSLAFCNTVMLHEPGNEAAKQAILLRVIPISVLEAKWVFPQTELVNAELSMIDADGDYILKGYSFKNASFFEFYKSYNPTDPETTKQLFDRITSSTGSVSMLNSHGQECILAFTPVDATSGWTLLGFVPAQDLHVDKNDWLLFGVVSAGLLSLFLCDMFYMPFLNKRLQITAREAEFANKAKTDFLSTMSHDIRTPMNAIIGLTTIAENNLGDADSTADSLRKISLASNRKTDRYQDGHQRDTKDPGRKGTIMKKLMSVILTTLMLLELAACGVAKPNLQFSVNKESANLDMANEFMRFLIPSEELNEMAQKKGLMSPTKDLSFNSMYAAFGAVPKERILSPEEFGLSDDAVIQVRLAVYGVGTGVMSIDDAVAGYGSYAP